MWEDIILSTLKYFDLVFISCLEYREYFIFIRLKLFICQLCFSPHLSLSHASRAPKQIHSSYFVLKKKMVVVKNDNTQNRILNETVWNVGGAGTVDQEYLLCDSVGVSNRDKNLRDRTIVPHFYHNTVDIVFSWTGLTIFYILWSISW